VVLARREVADLRVPANRATLGVDEHREHRLDVGGIGRQRRRRAGRLVMELVHVCRQRAAQLVDPWDQRLEVIAVLDARRLGDLRRLASSPMRFTLRIV
jgi:hypothetical protein